MNRPITILSLAVLVSAVAAAPSLAWSVAPAPVLGAGLPGLAMLVVAGGGYLAVKTFRRRRD